MLCRMAVAMSLATAAWGLAVTDCARAQGLGWATSPSTFWQRVGYGFGAGHHAPIVRTPMQEPPRQPRKALAPSCYGALGPSPLMITGCSAGRGLNGCGWHHEAVDYGFHSGQPVLAPSPSAPAPAPRPTPPPISTRAPAVLPTPPMPPTTSTGVGRGDFRQAAQYRWP